MKKYMFNHRRGKKISHVNNKGFSYMELMVAMVIIGIVGAAFTGVVFTSGKASVSHKLDLEALTIAQDMVEEARAYRDEYDNLSGWTRIGTHSKTIDGYSYEISTEVEDVELDELVNLKVSVRHSASSKPVVIETRIKIN